MLLPSSSTHLGNLEKYLGKVFLIKLVTSTCLALMPSEPPVSSTWPSRNWNLTQHLCFGAEVGLWWGCSFPKWKVSPGFCSGSQICHLFLWKKKFRKAMKSKIKHLYSGKMRLKYIQGRKWVEILSLEIEMKANPQHKRLYPARLWKCRILVFPNTPIWDYVDQACYYGVVKEKCWELLMAFFYILMLLEFIFSVGPDLVSTSQ